MINITYESVISHIFEILALIFVPAFIIGCFYFSALGLYRFFKGKTKKELLEDNARLLEENQQLKEKNAELTRRIEHVENVIIQNERQLNEIHTSSKIIKIGTKNVPSNDISYISTQSFEQTGNKDARNKIIHYVNSDKTDTENDDFKSILDQLDKNCFLQINKSVVVNLQEIQKYQGNDLYLKNVDKPFTISDAFRKEFDERISKM